METYGDMQKKSQDLYQKFKESRQEKIRLTAALEGFFLERPDGSKGHWEEYGAYLKLRIRPVMELLIEAEDIQKMEMLEGFGWFGQNELEQFLRSARERKKPQAYLWLLRLKNRKYGYRDRDFSL